MRSVTKCGIVAESRFPHTSFVVLYGPNYRLAKRCFGPEVSFAAETPGGSRAGPTVVRFGQGHDGAIDFGPWWAVYPARDRGSS